MSLAGRIDYSLEHEKINGVVVHLVCDIEGWSCEFKSQSKAG